MTVRGNCFQIIYYIKFIRDYKLISTAIIVMLEIYCSKLSNSQNLTNIVEISYEKLQKINSMTNDIDNLLTNSFNVNPKTIYFLKTRCYFCILDENNDSHKKKYFYKSICNNKTDLCFYICNTHIFKNKYMHVSEIKEKIINVFKEKFDTFADITKKFIFNDNNSHEYNDFINMFQFINNNLCVLASNKYIYFYETVINKINEIYDNNYSYLFSNAKWKNHKEDIKNIKYMFNLIKRKKNIIVPNNNDNTDIYHVIKKDSNYTLDL